MSSVSGSRVSLSTTDFLLGTSLYSSINDAFEVLKAKKTTPPQSYDARCRRVLKILEEFVLNKLPLRVTRIVSCGSFSKETNVVGRTDIDIVFFVDNLEVSDSENVMKHLLYLLRAFLKQRCDQLGCTDVIFTPSALCFFIDGINIELMPTTDVFGPPQNRTADSLARTYQMIVNAPESDWKWYRAVTRELQFEFIDHQPKRVLELIRILNFWTMERDMSTTKRHLAFVLELLAVHTVEVNNLVGDFDLSIAFSLVLENIRNYRQLNVSNYKSISYYDVDMIPEYVRACRPLLMDPSNPTYNVAASFHWGGLVLLANDTPPDYPMSPIMKRPPKEDTSTASIPPNNGNGNEKQMKNRISPSPPPARNGGNMHYRSQRMQSPPDDDDTIVYDSFVDERGPQQKGRYLPPQMQQQQQLSQQSYVRYVGPPQQQQQQPRRQPAEEYRGSTTAYTHPAPPPPSSVPSYVYVDSNGVMRDENGTPYTLIRDGNGVSMRRTSPRESYPK